MQNIEIKRGLSEICKPLAIERFWLEELLDNCILKTNDDKRKTETHRTGFSASSAGMCPRLIQLQMNSTIPRKVDSKGQRIFDNGSYTHSRYGEYLKKSEFFVDSETKFSINIEDFVIIGRSDFVVKNREDKLFVLELKSINDRGYEAVISEGMPKIEHLLQINIYLKGLNIPDGVVIYENKNTQELKFFQVSYNEEKFQEVVDVFRKINLCNKSDILVPKPDKCPNPRYCEARNFCKKG